MLKCANAQLAEKTVEDSVQKEGNNNEAHVNEAIKIRSRTG